MTIIASVKVRDGLVLGTDSMSQIQGQDPAGNIAIIKSYSNAKKLFQVNDWPIGVMSYGLGNLGQRSIQGLVSEFGAEYQGNPSVEDVTNGLFAFFEEKYNEIWGEEENKSGLGFFVAGYSRSEPFPEEWEFALPRDSQAKQVRPLDKFGASWRGVDMPFTRLYKGFDPRGLHALKERGVSQQAIDDAFMPFESPVVYDGMPVQDAINFVTFILDTTIGMATFELGPPTCGGPLQVATILPESGLAWISEPRFSIPGRSRNDD